MTVGDVAKHTSEMMKTMFISSSLWENLSQYTLHVSLCPWRMADYFCSGQISHVPGRTKGRCHWGSQLFYRTLKSLSQSRWCLWLVFSPNRPNRSIFSCLPGLWLPLPSVICSMKKLSWGQASAGALSRVKKSCIHSLSLLITSSLTLGKLLNQFEA